MGKGFSFEFRNMIVNLHLEEGRSFKWIAEEYGVSVSTIGRWVICHRNKEASKAKQLSKGVPFDSPIVRFSLMLTTGYAGEGRKL